MNSDNGQIIEMEALAELSRVEAAKYVPIDEKLMTLKQQATLQVSKFDNRSDLGKIRVQARGRIRNKSCPCGSGVKFKRCCWNKTF